jgi:hypothetical protein
MTKVVWFMRRALATYNGASVHTTAGEPGSRNCWMRASTSCRGKHLDVTQRALSVAQQARSVNQRALSVTQQALSVTQRALSVTQRALSVTQLALSAPLVCVGDGQLERRHAPGS